MFYIWLAIIYTRTVYKCIHDNICKLFVYLNFFKQIILQANYSWKGKGKNLIIDDDYMWAYNERMSSFCQLP